MRGIDTVTVAYISPPETSVEVPRPNSVRAVGVSQKPCASSRRGPSEKSTPANLAVAAAAPVSQVCARSAQAVRCRSSPAQAVCYHRPLNEGRLRSFHRSLGQQVIQRVSAATLDEAFSPARRAVTVPGTKALSPPLPVPSRSTSDSGQGPPRMPDQFSASLSARYPP